MGPRGNFFGKFPKMVISSKSCSRCGGSTIFEGRRVKFQQMLAKKHKKNQRQATTSKKLWFGDQFFRAGRVFLTNFGSCLAAKWRPKTVPEFEAHWGPTLQWRPRTLTGSLLGPGVSFLRFLCHFRRSGDQFRSNFGLKTATPRSRFLVSFLK